MRRRHVIAGPIGRQAAEVCAVGRELLDPSIKIDDVQIAIAIAGDPDRGAYLAVLVAVSPPTPKESAFARERLNAMVVRVGDEERSVGADGHALRGIELTEPRSSRAPLANEDGWALGDCRDRETEREY